MITVVIPALNEERAIESTVHGVRSALEKAAVPHEIIVVNDGSTDKTHAVAESAGAKVIDHPKTGGYGRALKTGIAAAGFDIVGIIDADGTYPVERLVELLALVAVRGFDMAVGARTGKAYRGSFPKMPARRVFVWLAEYATGTKIADINSGLRVFRRELALRFAHTISNGFSFTATITLAALLNGFFVAYLPVEYGPRVGRSHVSHLRDSLRALQIIVENILYYNPLKLFLLLCQVLGCLAVVGGVFAVFSEGPFATGGAVTLGVALVATIVVAAIGFGAVHQGSARNLAVYRGGVPLPVHMPVTGTIEPSERRIVSPPISNALERPVAATEAESPVTRLERELAAVEAESIGRPGFGSVVAAAIGVGLFGAFVARGLMADPARAGGGYGYALPLELAPETGNAGSVGGTLVEAPLFIERATAVVVRLHASGRACPVGSGYPQLQILVDDANVASLVVRAPREAPQTYEAGPLRLSPGPRRLQVKFVNDYYEGDDCDRNVWLDRVTVASK